MDSASYMIGFNMGNTMAKDSLNISVDHYFQGFLKGLANDTSFISPADLKKIQNSFNDVMMKKQAAKQEQQKKDMEIQGKANRSVGDKFLEENKKKPGVKVTPSGLQYEVLKEGTGKTISENEMFKMHIRGFYVDGKKFDDSYERGEPIKIAAKGQVKGWSEAFQMMKVGSKYKLYMSPELGWGERGAPPQIPPSAVTIFEIEILSLEGSIPDEKNPEPVRVK